MQTDYVLVGLDWAELMMQFLLHITCSLFLMHMYSLFNILVIFELLWDFSECFFLLPLHSQVYVSVSWHQNVSLLHLGTLFVSGHLRLLILPPLLFGFVMRMPGRLSRRTFLDEVFIQNTESFCLTSLTLTYALSFIVGVGSHCVTSRSLVPPY